MPITKNTDANPLICKVEYAFFDEIASMVNVELHKVKITMKDGKVFKPFYGTPSDYSFTEPAEKTTAGLIYKQNLGIYYPGINDQVQSDLIRIEQKPIIAKIYYQNNLIQVVGSDYIPAQSIHSYASNDSTGFGINIVCNAPERARFLIPD